MDLNWELCQFFNCVVKCGITHRAVITFKILLQISKGVLAPHITFCSYMPLSVPVWWKFVFGDNFPLNTKLGIFEAIFTQVMNLQEQAFSLCTNTDCQVDGLIPGDKEFQQKLASILQQLGGKTLTFTLLRNIPNVNFDEIFNELGPRYEDTIKYCSNAQLPCDRTSMKKFRSGQFATCFDYNIQENKSSNVMSNEGLSYGTALILNTGVQLATVALNQILKYYPYGPLVSPGFQNAFSAFSAEGFRLMINSPGVMPNIDQQGVNIAPGQSTLISITGREVIRLPHPYSSCTQSDLELKALREESIKFIGEAHDIHREDGQTTYAPQNCRTACLQRLILLECKCFDLDSKIPFGNLNQHLCGALNETSMNMFLDPYTYEKQDCFENATTLGSDKCKFLHKMIDDLACVSAVKKKYTEQTAAGEYNGPNVIFYFLTCELGIKASKNIPKP